MNIDIAFLEKEFIGEKIPKPPYGTLSGHAAGEPFAKRAYELISKKYPKNTYAQYEYLNSLYLANPQAISVIDRYSLIKSPPLAYLLNRGKSSTKDWTPQDQFSEKQNDTADILIIQEDITNIIDVKTFNINKNGQPPNIISSFKIANLCKLILESKDFSSLNIIYIGVSWDLKGSELECKNIAIRELFKTNPSKLYINWAAALQIQFHVERLGQDYKGSIENWCKDYLSNFVKQAQHRVGIMKKIFIDPFIRFI